MDKLAEAAALVFVMVMVACLFYGIGHDVGSATARRDAIKAGVARYTVNATTGETKFEFIKPQESR